MGPFDVLMNLRALYTQSLAYGGVPFNHTHLNTYLTMTLNTVQSKPHVQNMYFIILVYI